MALPTLTTKNIFFSTKLAGQLILVVFILTLSGCNKNPFNSNPDSNTQEVDSTVSLTDVLAGNHLISVLQDDQLVLVDPEFPQPVSVYTLTSDQRPNTHQLFNFRLSPEKKHIVWYTANQGLLKLDLEKQKVDILRPANDWLNQNPHFSFAENQDVVFIVDNQGQDLVRINLDNNTASVISIPYPFGNLFKLAPNGNSVVFVSGFQTGPVNPEYMFTTISGESPRRFSTSAPSSLRHLIVWTPDSSGVIVVEDNYRLTFVSQTNPQEKTPFFDLEPESVITDLARIEDQIYVLANSNRWFVIDANSRQQVAQIPIEIAEEIHRPIFFPWYDKSFLIEETLRLEPEEFHRLWLSSYIGTKKNVLDKYHQSTLQVDTPSL